MLTKDFTVKKVEEKRSQIQQFAVTLVTAFHNPQPRPSNCVEHNKAHGRYPIERPL